MIQHYILEETGSPVPCDDLDKWAKWYMKNHAHHIIDHKLRNGLRVKTGFVGREVDGRPVLWETNVLAGSHRKVLGRYGTKDASVAGHATATTTAMTMTEADITRGRF